MAKAYVVFADKWWGEGGPLLRPILGIYATKDAAEEHARRFRQWDSRYVGYRESCVYVEEWEIRAQPPMLVEYWRARYLSTFGCHCDRCSDTVVTDTPEDYDRVEVTRHANGWVEINAYSTQSPGTHPFCRRLARPVLAAGDRRSAA